MPGPSPHVGTTLRHLAPPCHEIVAAANAMLQDANARETMRHMHVEGYPLVKMVEDLGLEDDMTPRIRHILETLPPHVIEDIRRAMLAMLGGATFEIPLDCGVSDADLDQGAPIEVEVVRQDRRPTIRVRLAAS